MKKKCVMSLLLVALTDLVITGCGKQEVMLTEEFNAGVVMQEFTETEENTTVIQTDFVLAEDEFIVPIDERCVYHQLENPSWDYYHENATQELTQQTVFLEKLSETANGISDVNKWADTNNLDFEGMSYADENYYYDTYGDNAWDAYELFLVECDGEGREITLDFSNYSYANDFAEEDKDYVFQRIIWAKADNGVLYVATGHYTYAASSPHNGYITAIDLEDFHVIWKTAPLTCNSLSFEVIGDAIVCGYGFTDEDDFLYILDKKTGMVQESIPLKTAADYIYQQDDILYVHTYDSDLKFQIIEK